MVRRESELTRELVRLLDGSRDRSALLRDLASSMAKQPVPGENGIETIHDSDWWQEQLSTKLEQGLKHAARMALLVAD